MCELCELCELFVKKSHRFLDGIFLFLLSRIYSLPSTFGTPEGQLEQPQASGTRALALLERRIAATHVRVCDDNAMNVR